MSLAWNDSIVKLGLAASQETSSSLDDNLIEVDEDIDLLVSTISWQKTTSDDLYLPSQGWSAFAQLRASTEQLLSDVEFLQGSLTFNALQPLGNSRIKFRFKLGGTLIDDGADLPESIGFLAGGNDSVRGYRFESIGQERNGETNVAKNIVVASLEYQHPVRKDIYLATFLDIGDAFDSNPDYKKGAGVGLRWRLPFGALRFDVASALDLDGKPLRAHFSFGTDL